MLFQTIILSILSLVILFILTKSMGYRQITQLSMYDYIIGITIGSIASEMIVLEDFQDMVRPIAGMIIYALFTSILSLLSQSSLSFRHFIEGNPITLYCDDHILTKNLKKAKMDVNEFLMELRIQGYFDLTQIERVILETNGHISIFVKTQYRPIIIDDLFTKIEKEKPLITLVINGQLLVDQLHLIHKDEKWLLSQLKVKGYDHYKQLVLLLYQQDGQIIPYSQQ